MYYTPFNQLDYAHTVWGLNLMETINGKDFTAGQKVAIIMALHHSEGEEYLMHDYNSAVRCLAANLQTVPDFDAFDASILLALLFDRPKETTLEDIMKARSAR